MGGGVGGVGLAVAGGLVWNINFFFFLFARLLLGVGFFKTAIFSGFGDPRGPLCWAN